MGFNSAFKGLISHPEEDTELGKLAHGAMKPV